MADEARRRLEMRAALKQIKTIQKRQTRNGQGGGKRWRVDVPFTTLAVQGIGIFIIGLLVGLGLYVLYSVLTG